MNDFGRIEKRLQAAHHAVMEAVDNVTRRHGAAPADAIQRLADAKQEYDAACKEVHDYMEGRVQQEMQGFAEFLAALTRQTAHAGQPFPSD